MDSATKPMGSQKLREIGRLGFRTDYPVARDFLAQVFGQDFTDTTVSRFRSETGPRHHVSWPSISGKGSYGVTIVVKLNPGQSSLDSDPFDLVTLDCGCEFLVRKVAENRHRQIWLGVIWGRSAV